MIGQIISIEGEAVDVGEVHDLGGKDVQAEDEDQISDSLDYRVKQKSKPGPILILLLVKRARWWRT